MPTNKRFDLAVILHGILIVIIALAAYANTFSVPFQFDDEDFIVQNPLIRDFGGFTDSSKAKALELPVNVRYSSQSRSVSYLTFWLNYKVNKLNVAGYHLVNLLIHILNGMLVYALVSLTFKTPSLISSRLSGRGRYIALFSALIFVAHPVQTEAVTYITQRFTSLVALFYLAAVVWYVRWRQSGQEKRGRRAVWYALSFIATLLAMKTKENAFTLPLAITMYEFIFFSGAVKKRLYPLAPFFIAMLIVPMGLINAERPVGEAINLATRTQKTSRLDYLFTEFGVIVTYIRLLFLPVNQNLDYDYPVYKSFFVPQVFFPFLLLLTLIIGACYLLKRASGAGSGLRLLSFGVFWFFITTSIESSIIPLYHVIYEHRVYLPSLGIIIAAVSALFMLSERLGRERATRATVYFLAIVTMAFSFAAYARNDVWQNDVSLWDDVVAKSPGKARAQYNLGSAYAAHGKYNIAIEYLQKAVTLQPDYAEAHNNLALSFISGGRLEEAKDHLQQAIKLKPGYAEAYNNLGIVYEMQERLDDAIKEYQTAIELKPDFVMAHLSLSVAYKKMGLNAKSEGHLRRAKELSSKQSFGG